MSWTLQITQEGLTLTSEREIDGNQYAKSMILLTPGQIMKTTEFEERMVKAVMSINKSFKNL